MITRVISWFRKMDRFLWANEILGGCQIALVLFFNGENEIKEQYPDTSFYYEDEFREIERDHLILIHRIKHIELLLKEKDDVDFAVFQNEIYGKIKEVRNKFVNLSERVRNK